jgi:hypothetical protein
MNIMVLIIITEKYMHEKADDFLLKTKFKSKLYTTDGSIIESYFEKLIFW